MTGQRSVTALLWRPGVGGWELWRLRAGLGLLVVGVTAAAGAVLAAAVAGLLPHGGPPDGARALLVCAAAALQTEVGRRAEQVRRRLHGPGLYVNLLSAWFLVAAVLLPPALAATTAAVIHAHLQIRSIGPRGTPYRQLYSTAVAVLAAGTASVLAASTAAATGEALGLPALLTAMAALTAVNTVLVAAAVRLSDREARWPDLVGRLDANLVELATLCVGALVAVGMGMQPLMVAVGFLPLVALHRAVLVRHLERAASTDGKTGLLNAAGWHARAERALLRRRSPVSGLLVLDLDHFKAVNDTYGHLNGDVVLAAVGAALRGSVRDGDLAGRFGGEEFVVLVGGSEEPDERVVAAVAERIRCRVAALAVEVHTPDGPWTIGGLSVSIGAALAGGSDLHTLLETADTALYAAKRAGRNRVMIGQALPKTMMNTTPSVAPGGRSAAPLG